MTSPITDTTIESEVLPKRSPLPEIWQLLKMNRLAFMGLLIFIFFFFLAFSGLILTSGSSPVFDPAMVRLQEKLRPPLSVPEYDLLSSGQFHHRQAQVFKDAKKLNQAKDEYSEAADNYGKYIKQFPHDRNIYELNFYHADCLYYSLQYLKASDKYAWVRDSPIDDKYRERYLYGSLSL